MESFSSKWFIIYYSVLGICLIFSGGYIWLKKERMATFLREAADSEKPPRLFIRILKYLLLFTLPGLILSLIPFSWINLIFALWSLILIYIGGLQLVRWDHTRTLIKANNEKLSSFVNRSGAIMVAVGLAIFLLTFSVLNNTSI